MADEQEVLQTSQDTPPAQESESSTDESTLTGQESGGEEQSEHSSEIQEENPDDQAGQQVKPTRVEKRISNLISKIKEANTESLPPKKAPPLFTQEEIEKGEVDPNELEMRMRESVRSEVRKEIAMERMNEEYVSAANEHVKDLDSVKDLSPKVEKLAVKLYDTLNHQINPLTGQKMFVPAVKMSEIVADITGGVSEAAEGVAADNRRYSASVDQNQAIPTSGSLSNSRKSNPATDNFKEFEQNFASKA